MAIQFSCPACGQPIEVDDEYGEHRVSCPYCRNIVNAPSESDPTLAAKHATDQAPDARPVTPFPGDGDPSQQVPPSSAQPPPPPGAPHGLGGPPWPRTPIPAMDLPTQVQGRNLPGVIGLLSGMIAVGLYVAAATVIVSHHEELGFDPAGKTDQKELQQRLIDMSQELDKHPWLMTALWLFLGTGACWLVGLICSVIGMSRRYKRHIASILGLIVALLLPAFNCAGMFMG
jgi:hypothetical protein